MPYFDHMTIVAPTLAEGIGYVQGVLGIELMNGSVHRDMGTHNRRVRLGADCYLEIIAVDPDAQSPSHPRWFGLDQVNTVRANWAQGLRLRGWVARTDEIDAVQATHGHLIGEKKWLDDHFSFLLLPSGELPMEGALPCMIDVGENLPTAAGLVDQGVRLKEFILEHPDPPLVVSLFSKIGIVNAPRVIGGEVVKLGASIETRHGLGFVG